MGRDSHGNSLHLEEMPHTASDIQNVKIAIFGAGSIGCYLGGALISAGVDTVLIGRPRLRDRIAREGLKISDLDGRRESIAGSKVPFFEHPAALAGAGLVLVTVKSHDTKVAAEAIRDYASPTALVLGLQNGIGNDITLRREMKGRNLLQGVVPFNVVQMPDGYFHRGTEGKLTVQCSTHLDSWRTSFRAARLPLDEVENIRSVQWGKLLLNLNNPINALCGLPLQKQLSQRTYRCCLAALIDEALAVLQMARIRPAKMTRIAPIMLPSLLRLPDFLFTRLAGAMLRIDPEARSSMWEDLRAGRRTEVDFLNGAVVRLAEINGRDAPLNRLMVGLIRAAESGIKPGFTGEDLLRELQSGR